MNTLIAEQTAPRQVEAGQGLQWWRGGWALYLRSPGGWTGLGLVVMVLTIVVGAIPLLGGLAVAVSMPVLIGGWMAAARKVVGGAPLALSDLLLGFHHHRVPLLTLGALLLGVGVAIAALAALLGLGAVFGFAVGGPGNSTAGVVSAVGAGFLGLLASTLLGLILAMAFWFAPALIVLRNLSPVEALKASFAASLKNVVPFLVYSVVYIGAAIVASIPFGLGWVVLLPLLLLTAYVSYEDVFGP